MTYIIREFKTDRFVMEMDSFEGAFDKCIELYLKSDRRRSFYVAGNEVPGGKK